MHHFILTNYICGSSQLTNSSFISLDALSLALSSSERPRRTNPRSITCIPGLVLQNERILRYMYK